MARLKSEVQNDPLLNPTQARIIIYFIVNGESSLNKCSKEIDRSLQGIYDSSRLLIEKGLIENPKKKQRIYQVNKPELYKLLFTPISELLDLELSNNFFNILYSVIKDIARIELNKIREKNPLDYENLAEMADDLKVYLASLDPKQTKQEYKQHIEKFINSCSPVLKSLQKKLYKKESRN